MNLLRLREDGVPIIGFTWFGLIDMKDWDTAVDQTFKDTPAKWVFTPSNATNAKSPAKVPSAGSGILRPFPSPAANSPF